MRLGEGGSCDCAQDDRGGDRRRAMTRQPSFRGARPSRHSARSEAQSQNPPPSSRHPGRGSCDCAQDDRGGGRRRATTGSRRAEGPAPAVILRGAKRSRRIHPRKAATRRVDPATARRMTGEGIGAGRRQGSRRSEGPAPAVRQGRGLAQGDDKAAVVPRGPPQPSFCAERSAVAESTPEQPPPGAWILRLRAGRQERHRASSITPRSTHPHGSAGDPR